jgi:adenine-specific DNA-methyltransferase
VGYRLIGNKTRLLDVIVEMVRERTPAGGRVADLMCGTGSVSEALALAGFSVYASDLMTFTYLHARVRLTMARPPLFRALGMPYAEVLGSLNQLDPIHGYYWREFSPAGEPLNGSPPRMYFSAPNAGRIDAISARLARWRQRDRISEREHVLLRHDLVLAANRVANIAGTYGHFRSSWTPSALNDLNLRPTRFTASRPRRHRVRQGAAELLAPALSADLCYLDPPYTKRQYAANYHLPETIARGDEPRAVGISGLRPWRDQYSDFCSKVRVRDSFRAIIAGMDCPQFLISYSEDGLLSEADMTALLSEFGTVESHRVRAQRFRSNQSPLSAYLTEYVFDLRKKATL